MIGSANIIPSILDTPPLYLIDCNLDFVVPKTGLQINHLEGGSFHVSQIKPPQKVVDLARRQKMRILSADEAFPVALRARSKAELILIGDFVVVSMESI